MNKLIYKILHHPMLHKQTVVQATILISIINFLSKFVGYVREMLIAKYFGVTGVMDAYVIGIQIPTLVLGLFAGGLGTLIIPIYISRKQKDPQDAKRYVNQILVVWGAIFLVVSALTAVFAPQLVRIVAYGFKGERFELAVQITRLLALYGFLNIINIYFGGLIQAEKQFVIPALSAAGLSLLFVFLLINLNKYFGIYTLVLGIYIMLIGNFLVSIYLLTFRYKLLGFIKLCIDWSEIKEFFLLLAPLLISAGIGTINTIVDRSIASSLSHGSISALQYAQKISTLPFSLFVGSIVATILPSFSELASDKIRILDYMKYINKTIISLMYFMIPSAVFLILFSFPITKLFYERGVFDPKATSLTSFVNQMYCIGIFFGVSFSILMKVFYSFQNTLTPLLLSVSMIGFNIIGNKVLSKFLFAGGIALATSLSQLLAFLFACLLLSNYLKTKEHVPTMSIFNLFLEFVLLIIATIPMMAIAHLLISWTSLSSPFIIQAFKLCFVAFISGVVFYFASSLLKTKGQEIAQSFLIRGIKILKFKK